MPLTDKLKLPYVGVGEPLTFQMESQRYGTIDTQMQALFSILGDGVIEGWIISKNLPALPDGSIPSAARSTVYISPGNGHINSLACSTITWFTLLLPYIGTTDSPSANYVYAGTTNNSPLLKETQFVVSPAPITEPSFIPLGLVLLSEDETTGVQTLTIDTSSKIDIGFIGQFLAVLLQHKHGKNGISPIDLSTEVKGILSSANIDDIPAERITSGVIDPQRFVIDHLNLLNAGEIPHADLDSAVKLLQKANKKLFGDISTTNLMQLITATKRSLLTVDRYFRNMIIIIPGLDNNTFANPDSFLEPTAAYEIGLYEAGETTYEIEGEEIVISDNAAIVDYENSEITGIVASGHVIHEHSIDNAVEFLAGTYDDTFISITAASGYAYGYGWGYGYGLDYFDVFGVASGVADEFGRPVHEGYGTSEFEIENSYKYAYGYGFEYLTGGMPDLPGHATVTLKRNPSESKIYRYDHQDGDPLLAIEYDGDRWIDYVPYESWTATNDGAGPQNTDPTTNFILAERLLYIKGEATSGAATINKASNRRLVYLMNTDTTTQSTKWDWSAFSELQIKIQPTTLLEDVGDWYFKAYSKTDVSGEIAESDEQILVTGDLIAGENIFTLDLNLIQSTGFDKSKITKFIIYSKEILELTTANTDIIVWDKYITEIGLKGEYTYSKIDANNTIEDLFIVIPFTPAATLENISWVGNEPSSSRILLYLRTADDNTSALDGFTLLNSASFGNAYTNKANLYPLDPITVARPSGSAISEGVATHIEIRAILQPSVDGNYAPELNAITIRYSVAGEDMEIVYNTDEAFNINTTSGTIKRSNISMDTNSNVIIKDYLDINSRIFGQNGFFQKLVKRSDGIYEVADLPDYYGTGCFRTQDQYIAETAAAYGRISAIRKLSSGDYLLADSTNHRLVCINSTTNAFKWGVVGPTTSGDTAATLSAVFAHYNYNDKVIYISFSRVIDEISNADILKWSITNGLVTKAFSTGDVVEMISAVNLSVVATGMAKITLSQSTYNKIDSMSGTLSIMINSASLSTDVLRVAIERYNVHYGPIVNPIDIKVDDNDNILVTQAKNNISCDSIILFNSDSRDLNIPANILKKWNYSINGSSQVSFSFDSVYGGSCEILTDTDGSKKLLVADTKNQRVLVMGYDDLITTWQFDKNDGPSIDYIESYLYPTSATYAANEKFYIALTDSLVDNNTSRSKVIEVGGDYQISQTWLEGIIKHPQDLYMNENMRLLIST